MPDLPLKVLSKSNGSKIAVRLKNGVEYIGRLKDSDVYMNLILIDTEEFVRGEKKARLGRAFLRGNNILFVRILS
ncbi:MAG: U6 snRNA-associated Sm-like protein LSm6 [Candidatus Hodarchaeales archaeon]|jgi:small nuclear ribonucleoprotein (snRNP)-like protein